MKKIGLLVALFMVLVIAIIDINLHTTLVVNADVIMWISFAIVILVALL